MRLSNQLVFSTVLTICSGWANAASIEDELIAIKARLQQLEQHIQLQNETISKQNEIIEAKSKQIEELADSSKVHQNDQGWFNKIEIGGVVEVEAVYKNPDSGDSSSDAVLATAEIGVAAEINDWVSAETALLYEEDDTDLEVDIAVISIANPNGPWFVGAGLMYTPFGTFETNLISDPLTLEIGEIRETSVLAGIEANGFTGGLYAFNGELSEDGDDDIDNLGAFLGYAHENENSAFGFNMGYITDIGDTDTLQDVVQENLDDNAVEYSDHVGGFAVSGMVTFGSFNIFAEYLTATDEFEMEELAFDGEGARPEALNIEAGYTFNLGGIAMVAALAYQRTDEAVVLELPQERIIGGLSAEIFENTLLSIEWAHDEDYSDSEGGTDELGGDTITSQLAVEF